MSAKYTKLEKNFTKTVIIIIGIILAFIMSLGTPVFTADNILSKDLKSNPTAKLSGELPKSSGSGYSPEMRLFHIFTKNLPFLNNK